MINRAHADQIALDELVASWAQQPPGFQLEAFNSARVSSIRQPPCALAAACAANAMRFVVLDRDPIRNKADLLTSLTRALSLPTTAKTGWDAATDAIANYLATPPAATAVLLWQAPWRLRRQDAEAWHTALEVFAEASIRAPTRLVLIAPSR